MQFDPKAFGKRLSRELPNRGDLKPFQEKLSKKVPHVRGTSYASVWSYVNGQAPPDGPRPEVVQAMAEILGVRADYLLYDGPRTELDFAVESRAGQREPDQFEIAIAAAERSAGQLPLFSAAEGQFWRVWAEFMNRALGRDGAAGLEGVTIDDEVTPELGAEIAERLIRVLRAPLDELGLLEDWRETGGGPLDSYVIAMCEVLMTALSREYPAV